MTNLVSDCLNLKASVANENFVDSVAYSLAEAWVHYKDTKPFAIYADETMIGFVSMYVGEENYQIINFLLMMPIKKGVWNCCCQTLY